MACRDSSGHVVGVVELSDTDDDKDEEGWVEMWSMSAVITDTAAAAAAADDDDNDVFSQAWRFITQTDDADTIRYVQRLFLIVIIVIIIV